MTTEQLVEEWKKGGDPFLLDVEGFQKFLDKRIPKVLKEKEKHRALGWFKRLRLLDDRLSGVYLEQRIYEDILVKGEEFRPDRKEEFKENVALLSELLDIHLQYVEEKGLFRDMFGDYMQEDGQTSFRSGKFFTPYTVCDFMAQITLMDALEGKPETICDPAAGTGRFMLSIAKIYREKLGYYNFVITNTDIDQQMWVYCTMNAILHRIPSFNIWGDSLAFKFWDGFAVIPLGGIATWHRIPKEKIYVYMTQNGAV